MVGTQKPPHGKSEKATQDKGPASRPTVYIASDHAGFALKYAIQRALGDWEWKDLGTRTTESVDYPDFAATLARKVAEDRGSLGILICGSGIGMSIAANKIHGIRAAVVENPVSARLSREHNGANVLCLGSRFLAPEYAAEIAKVWLETPCAPEARHQIRIQKISRLEGGGHEQGL